MSSMVETVLEKPEKYGALIPAARTLYDDITGLLIDAPETLTPFEAVQCLSLINQRLVTETAGNPQARLTLFLYLAANYSRVARDYLMLNAKGGLSDKDRAAFEKLGAAFRQFQLEIEHMPGLYEMEELSQSLRIN